MMPWLVDCCACIKRCRQHRQQETIEMYPAADTQDTGANRIEYITPGNHDYTQSASHIYANIGSGTGGYCNQLDPGSQPSFYDKIAPPLYYNVNNYSAGVKEKGSGNNGTNYQYHGTDHYAGHS